MGARAFTVLSEDFLYNSSLIFAEPSLLVHTPNFTRHRGFVADDAFWFICPVLRTNQTLIRYQEENSAVPWLRMLTLTFKDPKI